MAEKMLYDSDAMCRFEGIELGNGTFPDESTILNVWHVREKHVLTEQLFAEVLVRLADQGGALYGWAHRRTRSLMTRHPRQKTRSRRAISSRGSSPDVSNEIHF